MAPPDEALRIGVLTFYREEIRRRYTLENVRCFKPFDEISDEKIESLREFFLEQIYPTPEERKKLDDAFDRLRDMLTSPRRMKPLMGAAVTSLWRMGRKLPAAVAAGRSTIDAYMKTRELEALLLEEAISQGVSAKDTKKREKVIALLDNVPEKHVLNLVNDILNLFNALTNVEMLKVAVAFMEQCEAVMGSHPDLYDAEDAAGIALGRELIEGGIALFTDMKNSELRNVIRGIQLVEMDWYRKVQAEAAA